VYEQHVGVPHGHGPSMERGVNIANPLDGLTEAAGAIGHAVQVEEARRDQIDLMQYEQQLSELDQRTLLGDEEHPGALRTQGTNAAGITKTTLAAWDRDANTFAPKLRSPEAQARADQLRTVRRQDASEKLVGHEFQQGKVADEQTTTATLATIQNEMVAFADDPKTVQAGLARLRTTFASYAGRNGIPAPAAALKLGQLESEGMRSVIEAQLAKNPESAIQTFRANQDTLLGADRIAMQARLRPFELEAVGRSVGDALWTGSAPSDFEGAAAQVMHSEGGFVENDGGKGPTNYGINSVANPDINVRNLTPVQAKALYKSRYWDAIGADNLPPALRMGAFDAAVNQGVAWTQAALKKSGGDPVKFAELRRERYRSLIANNPDKYAKFEKSWMRRVDESLGTPGPKLPADPADAIDAKEAAALTATDALPIEEAQQAKERIREQATRARLELQNSQQARQAAKQQQADFYGDTVAKLGDGLNVPLSQRPTKESLIAAFGEYEGNQKYEELQIVATAAPDVARLKTATSDEAASILTRYTPDASSSDYAFRSKVHDSLVTSFKAIQAERNANPATFLMQNSPVVQASYAQLQAAQQGGDPAAITAKGSAFVTLMETEQARLGVPVKSRAILPRSAVTAISDEFAAHMAKGDVRGAVGVMRSALAPFGDGGAKIIPQLGKDQGMVGRMALEGIDERTIETYAAAAAMGDKELESAVGSGNWNKVRTAARVELAALDVTGSTEWPAYYDATVKLAAGKLRQMGAGGSPEEATRQAAAELVNDRYAFAGSYRVPKADIMGRTINTDAVRDGAVQTLNGLTIHDFSPTDAHPPGVSADEFKALRLARIQRTGKWVNNGDETGLILGYTDDAGRVVPVLDPKGKPIVRTWSQLTTHPRPSRTAVVDEMRDQFGGMR
jgi:hypothetical protein